ELARIEAAAEAAAMTLTGFCAMAALAAARGEPVDLPGGLPSEEELGEMQRELYAARVAVNKAGTNLNQAVAQLNATGEPPVWLERAVARGMRAVEQLDAVVSRIHRVSPTPTDVIPAVHPRGTNVGGLLRYLFGPGKREEACN